MQALVVDAEVVGDLVHDGLADHTPQHGVVGAGFRGDRHGEQRDAIGQHARVVAAALA